MTFWKFTLTEWLGVLGHVHMYCTGLSPWVCFLCSGYDVTSWSFPKKSAVISCWRAWSCIWVGFWGVQFENSNDIGVFAKLTNAYCLVALGGSENFYRWAAHSPISVCRLIQHRDCSQIKYIMNRRRPIAIQPERCPLTYKELANTALSLRKVSAVASSLLLWKLSLTWLKRREVLVCAKYGVMWHCGSEQGLRSKAIVTVKCLQCISSRIGRTHTSGENIHRWH